MTQPHHPEARLRPRTRTRRAFVRVALAAALAIAPALTGCLGGPAADPAQPPVAGVPFAAYAPVAVPDPIAIADGEVVERNPTNATLRWSGSVGGGPATLYIGATDNYAPYTIDGEETMLPGYGRDVLLEAGYAVALVSLRGTGRSDGCYSYMNHPQNGPDANAVIDAIAAEPWSDGNVGMHGISYHGATQYDAVAYGPSPHLKAVVPVSGEWDEWNMLGSSYGAASRAALYHPGHRNREQGQGVTVHPSGSVWVNPERVNANHWCESTPDPETAHWQFALDGDKVGWFAERDLKEKLRGKRVPFFATFGLGYDGHTPQTNGLWEVMPTPRRLMLGPWDHQPPTSDWEWFTRVHAIPWFDHYLRGGPRRRDRARRLSGRSRDVARRRPLAARGTLDHAPALRWRARAGISSGVHGDAADERRERCHARGLRAG